MATDDINRSEWGCETDDLYMIHAVFRKAFGHAEEMVRGTNPTDAKRVLLVSGHIKEALEALHNHHAHEDNLYWDLIKLRAPEAAEDVNRMVRHHQEIAQKIDDMLPILEAWKVNPSDKETLIQALSAFKLLLLNHLDDEETNVKPVAARVLTQKEWNKVRSAGLKEIPFSRMLYQVGYMLKCAPTEALKDEFWQAMPAPIRVLYKHFGVRKFEAEWKELYGEG